MASLSMVIIASIIGGTADIGWEVLSTIRKAQFGESLLAGMVIALMAMVIDRITAGLAARSGDYDPDDKSFAQRHRYWIAAALGGALFFILAQIIGILNEWPRDWEISPARAMNEGLTYVVVNFRDQIETVKKFAFFFVMLPAKIGLQGAVSPFTWGFELTFAHKIAYAIGMTVLACWAAYRVRVMTGLVILIFAILIYFGLTGVPWPALLLICAVAGWKIGGRALGIGTALGLGFIVVTGTWPEAMLSIYLCGIAVLISFIIGTAIGIWAAHNDTVSAIIRPFNDTLQTMPLFVLLIPFVMVFKIGEFTALLAIIAYAIVPAIRYAEHGLRSLPAHVIEAATMIGATNRQMLWQVKIPLALPVMMLGLNQTILYAFAMLVIAALIGTTGLGQSIYGALAGANVGLGIASGAAMAILALVADRLVQGFAEERRQALGL